LHNSLFCSTKKKKGKKKKNKQKSELQKKKNMVGLNQELVD